MLRPQFDGEQVKALGFQIEQHRLIRRPGAAVPAQPGQNDEQGGQPRRQPPFQPAKPPLHRLGVDFLVRGVKRGRGGRLRR